MRYDRMVFPVALAMVMSFSGCGDSSPTADEAQPDEAALELVAEAALEVNDQEGVPLPSLHNLLRRTYKTIREEGGHERGIRLLRAGQTLSGIIAVLGPGVVDEALAGVDQALARLDDRFAGRPLTDRIKRILNRARTLADRGHAAAVEGRLPAALGAALASADLIRSLSPRFQARKAIQHASDLLSAAREAVSVGPTDTELAALKKARRFLNAAMDAFKEKEYRKAWRYAGESLALSREVLKGRSGG